MQPVMTAATAVLWTTLAAAVSLGYFAFGVYLLRQYEGIGVRSLAAFSFLWSGNYLLSSGTIYVLVSSGITSGADLTPGTLPETTEVVVLAIVEPPLSALLTVTAIFAWLWFVLRYTRQTSQREKLAVAGLGGGTLLVLTLNGVIGGTTSIGQLSIDPALRNSITEFATVVEILGTGIAVGVGIALLYTTTLSHRTFSRRAAAGLTVPILLPWLIGYLYQFGLVVDFSSIGALRTVALAAGLLGLWIAVSVEDLFEQLPASRTIGRQTAFDISDTPIVVLNTNEYIADINPAAAEMFGVRSRETVGMSVSTLLPETIETAVLLDSESITFTLPNSETVLEAVATVATDDSGQQMGTTIVFNDITDERRRQQRIQVLNRVLRHNLRNDINAVKGFVGLLADSDGETTAYRDRVDTKLDGLVSIGDKAQSTEQVINAEPRTDSPISLEELVWAAADADHKPHLQMTNGLSETTVLVNPAILESVVAEILDNAVRYGEDVTITVGYDPETTTLTLADDGPGIPEDEILALEIEQETALNHGSGLGLWLIKWGVNRFGGSVVFETGSSGTTIDIQLPPALVSTSASPA